MIRRDSKMVPHLGEDEIMDYTNLINEAHAHINAGHRNGYTGPLLAGVRTAIEGNLADSDQRIQLIELEGKLKALSAHPQKSFLGSTTVSL